MSKKEVHVQKNWREQGVGFVIAHPDDEALFWGALQECRAAGVPVTVILMTAGELGIAKDSPTTPKQQAAVRKAEFMRAMKRLGVESAVLEFADLGLVETPFTELLVQVLRVVREKEFAALFSFLPTEITPEFDHPDHNVTGQVARHAGAIADVRFKHPELPAPDHRPELYLWTTNRKTATHKVKLSKKQRRRRNQYLETQYPSQFGGENTAGWQKTFDKITEKKPGTKKHREYYLRVR